MDVYENEFNRIWIQDGILYFTYTCSELNLEIAKVCIKQRIDVCNGKTYPMLGDVSQVRIFTMEARKYLSSGESLNFLSAGAFLIKSQIEKYLGNFWLKIDRPSLPAKLFTDEAEAVKWLENYKINKLN